MRSEKLLKLILAVLVLILLLILIKASGAAQKLRDPVLTEPMKKSRTIPKIIWAYWNNNTLPEFIKMCVGTWRKHNPDFEINVITPKTLSKYVDINVKRIHWNDCPAREADIIRAFVIEKYGGFWSDASIIMTKSLNHFIEKNKEFIGYYLNGYTTNMNYPVIECWFFGSVAHGDFIRRWKAAFFNADNFPSIEYLVKYYINEGVDLQKLAVPTYLLMNVSAQYVMQKQMSLEEIRSTMYLQSAESGPFKYLHENGWDNNKALESLCKGENVTGIIKFTGDQRKIIINNKKLTECIFTGVEESPLY